MTIALGIIMACYIVFDMYVERNMHRRVYILEQAVANLIIDLDLLEDMEEE